MIPRPYFGTRASFCTRSVAPWGAIVFLAHCTITVRAADAQDINSQLRFTPQFTMPEAREERERERAEFYSFGLPFTELEVNANYLGRAGLTEDSTRLAPFAKGNFLPSAIPVPGQPFFGTHWRSNLQGNGNAVSLNVVGDSNGERSFSGYAQIITDSAAIPFSSSTPGGTGAASVTFREAFAQYNRLSVGVIETAFADPGAVPETLDLAGPNARTTVQAAGLGSGQGRLSYDLFDGRAQTGFLGVLSIEQPSPQIAVVPTSGAFARYPDFIPSIQYGSGEKVCDKYEEIWHVKFGSVFRSLGLENSTNTFRQTVFGWGTTLSGSFRFIVNENLVVRDRFAFGVTYGEGISHYITDLNTAPDTNDAVVSTGNVLTPLPVLAWYCGYTHNWSDSLRSTVSYSTVSLDSIVPAGATVSPYRVGNYVAANFLFHDIFYTKNVVEGKPPVPHNFYTGLEYLFGHKETLDGVTGDAHRVMWVTAVSK